jgi:hypothetical protein
MQELKSKCIEASKFYYDYLEQNNKGIERINISSKKLINDENDTWELHIGKKLFSLDSIKIHNRQYDEYYDLADFTIKEYDADNKLLIIKFIKKTNFESTPVNHLKIVSDLKFLIKNVENWYADNGQKISLDNDTNTSENEVECDSYLPDGLKGSQIPAFNNILNNKYNYIWGPPGTGKTRFVLSSAVLHYLNKDNPKIGIFAPTNNALEQVLESVIEHLDEEKRKTVIRIGAPSRKYAEKYRETCEGQELEKKLVNIERQIKNIQNVIEYHRGLFAFDSLFAIQKDIQKIVELNEQAVTLLIAKEQKEQKICAVINESNSVVNRLKRLINVGSKSYKSLIDKQKNELIKVHEQIEEINGEMFKYFSRIRNAETGSDKIQNEIKDINISNYSEISEQLKQLSRQIKEYLVQKESLARVYPKDKKELNDLLAQYKEDYKKLKAKVMRIEDRIKNCSIIGMTLDSYIGRFSNVKINFSNIFLDEASYSPLIKALTLFSNKCRITFLGDHKQLPPVCEFDSLNNIPGFHRLLWSKPSIFSEMVLNNDEEYCLNIAETTDCPEFKNTIRESMLLETHRYGQNLAELLDRLVYNIGYRSVLSDDCSIDLCFIDAPNPIVKDGRRNGNECERIHKILNGDVNENYCVLTPYRNQVALLQRNLPKARQEERILTIHKSQGREWDTVILSVVDGNSIQPCLTNSTNFKSQGLYVLNTAISRVRKKLIIVCDTKYWLSKGDAERQLISCLIRISRELSNLE